LPLINFKTTPEYFFRSQKPYLGAKPNCPSGHAMEISTPTDFVKASPEELLAKLQQGSLLLVFLTGSWVSKEGLWMAQNPFQAPPLKQDSMVTISIFLVSFFKKKGDIIIGPGASFTMLT
jgi:hypothetical protein